MKDGVLYAHKKEENATGMVLDDAEANSDVSLSNLTGIIDMSVGEVTVINVPTIKDGGSKSCDLELIKNIYKNVSIALSYPKDAFQKDKALNTFISINFS